jgi:glutamyl-Q tRNA(Asp) synthetase
MQMPDQSPPVFRFAPSPNGYLHLGHALSAFINADSAAKTGGRMLLRIEDIDAARCRPEYEAAIFEDLAWLGLELEAPVRRQSEHMSDYKAALDKLDAMGLVYPSFESRAEIETLVAAREASGGWPRDPDGAPLYPGAGKAMAPAERTARMGAGAPYALRLDMDAARKHVKNLRVGDLSWREGEEGSIAADPAAWGDVVLARKDSPTSYHLSVVVDDALQGVTHVARGRDLYPSTSVHRLLQELLGLPAPFYRHHRLILDSDGRKLSKSNSSTAIRELRAAGATPSDIRRMTGLN